MEAKDRDDSTGRRQDVEAKDRETLRRESGAEKTIKNNMAWDVGAWRRGSREPRGLDGWWRCDKNTERRAVCTSEGWAPQTPQKEVLEAKRILEPGRQSNERKNYARVAKRMQVDGAEVAMPQMPSENGLI